MIKSKINILRKNAIDFMYSKWSKDCLGKDNLNIGTEDFENISSKIFKEITNGKKPNKKPFIFRTAGQSGSGKTTQLMPSINSVIQNNKSDFINISVRTFSKFHPNYNELLEEFGDGMIREKTNGFALMMLFRTMEKLLINSYNILFEVTLLDDKFEKYLSKLAKSKRYNIHIHILSIPREKSDFWIEKRKNTSKIEGSRIVLKSSSNFFYDILPITLNKLIFYKFWSKNDKVFLWSAFDFKPIYISKIYNNKNFLKLFDDYRKNRDFKEKDELELLNSKIKWFNDYYSKFY